MQLAYSKINLPFLFCAVFPSQRQREKETSLLTVSAIFNCSETSPPLLTCTYFGFTSMKHLKIEIVINMMFMFSLNKYIN